VDREAPKVIKYIHAYPDNHGYMLGKILKNNQGVTHDVFIPPPTPRDNTAEGEGGE
jgi:hypothetical protein